MNGSNMGIYWRRLEPARTGDTGDTIESARESVRAALLQAADSLAGEDLPSPALDGNSSGP